jgi:hypothetical protein
MCIKKVEYSRLAASSATQPKTVTKEEQIREERAAKVVIWGVVIDLG